MREPSTEHARLVLSSEGFTVDDIPVEPPAKRADLRLWFGQEEYVVEAKLREPHEGWLELLKQVAQEGYASTSRPINPWNSLSSTLTEAHAQLLATPAGESAFRVLWLVALHDDDHFVISCIEKRLLGSVEVTGIDPIKLSIGESKVCYHHASNDFQRCAGIDAAVLGTRTGANLFVNYFSERREAFRKTQLHAMFSVHGAVVDPEVLEASGKAYMLGRDFVGPRNGQTQWKYLYERYGVRTTVMQEFQFAAMAAISVREKP
jgi:hypothetical protein